MLNNPSRQSFFHFHPERIAWVGSLLLGACFLLAFPFLWMMQSTETPFLMEKRERSSDLIPYSFSLALRQTSPGFSIPDLQGKMTFSFDPPRPDGALDLKRLLIRLKQTGDSKRVVLPCRLDLEYQGDQLRFAENRSLFWMDLAPMANGQIEAKGWISSLDGTKIDAGQFLFSGQDCPIQEAQEFPEGSPFRILAEAKWWGRDQFRSPGESRERIEIGELLEISEGEWLIWKEGKWQKGMPQKDAPIARIQSITAKMVIFEGWDIGGHTRIGLGLTTIPPFKTRGEDLLSAIRIRSEKQISCMIEKQCMVLKTGDWILKTAGRWKILRKKEERDAFLNGKLFGELFIFEQISQKQGQKMIQGRLFNPGRTQVVSIEMAAQGRKSSYKSRRQP